MSGERCCRWHYDIAAATGPVFELSTGLFVDRARVGLSFRQRWNDLDQMFLSVTNYAGVAREDRGNSTVTADTRSSIDHLAVRMLTVNAYYDFAAGSVVSPYLGAGVGPAFVTVAGVRFSDEYRDTAVNSDVYDAVDRLYRRARFTSERERVEYLLALYERLQAPLTAEAAVKRRSRRQSRHSR